MKNSSFAEEMKDQTKSLARDVILFAKEIPQELISTIILRQLVRSVSSTAANYRATCRARSGNEFYSKISITIEEADESLFWLELLDETELVSNSSKLSDLKTKANSIIAVLSTARKTCRNNQKNKA